MKVCRFIIIDEVRYGIVADEEILLCSRDLTPNGEVVSIENVRFLPPVSPSKIVCVGRNYAEHARELGNELPTEPLLFLKAPSAIIGDGDRIVIPAQSERVEHEAELAVVISRTCKSLSDSDNAFDYVLGYTCLNDITARDLQKTDVQFTRAKSFDSFCPIGPLIETDMDVSDLLITCRVNGEIRQQGRTSQMVFPVDFLIRYISRQMTLEIGDVIATGTPSGVSKIESGDVCEVEINGIGTLKNRVASGAELFSGAQE